MQIDIKGTNLELTEALKNYVQEKIGHLDHYFEGILVARVELEQSAHHQKGFFRCEVNLDVPQKHVLRAESTEADMYVAIDAAAHKLREQIEKMKGQQRSQDRRLARYMKSVFAWRPKYWKK